jgi:hypothetical protein
MYQNRQILKNKMGWGLTIYAELQESFFYFISLMNKCSLRVKDRYFWNPGAVSYAKMPRWQPNSTFSLRCRIYRLWFAPTVDTNVDVIPDWNKKCLWALPKYQLGHLRAKKPEVFKRCEILRASLDSMADWLELVFTLKDVVVFITPCL